MSMPIPYLPISQGGLGGAIFMVVTLRVFIFRVQKIGRGIQTFWVLVDALPASIGDGLMAQAQPLGPAGLTTLRSKV